MALACRVRFAPAPTGHMHIGNLRTALFNWLFARHVGGAFLIRIEDTDIERSLPEYTEGIIKALSWMGIESDEPLVIQSQRKLRHQEVAQLLLNQGYAYKCYCTPQELDQRLGKNAAEGEGYAYYDALCRTKDQADHGVPYVVRFKIPQDMQEITFNDLVRGPVTFKREQFDDFIIIRSDGSPTYNFVVVVDDADMSITHVIRGEDHIPNTPKQVLLYQACGFAVPEFAHLSLILGPHGNRLSKRDAATGVLEYQQAGFLAAALFNYLVRLGWSHGDQELFTLDELIRYFSLEQVGKKGAIFDIQKLEWMNSVYIRQTAASELVSLIARDLDPSFRSSLNWLTHDRLYDYIALFQDRSKTLRELADHVMHLGHGPKPQELAVLKTFPSETQKYLVELEQQVHMVSELDQETAQTMIKELCSKFNIKLPELAQPLRIVLTGKTTSPSVYALLAVLGKDEVLKRLRLAINQLHVT